MLFELELNISWASVLLFTPISEASRCALCLPTSSRPLLSHCPLTPLCLPLPLPQKTVISAVGDANMRNLQKGDVIQLERKG